jgi:3-polyprenyl-4-hydroxybenzoate decarboxylase
MLTQILRMQGFKVKDVVMQAMLTVVIQLEVDGLDKPRPGYGDEAGRAIGATYTFVVGPDIDPYNMEEVMWAANIRAGKIKWQERPKPPSDGLTEPEYGLLNPVLDKGGFMVIDATIPVPERFDYFPPRTEPPEWERQAVQAMAKKLKK